LGAEARDAAHVNQVVSGLALRSAARRRGHDLVDLALRLGYGVDAAQSQSWRAAIERRCEMRGRVGGRQTHGLAALGQRHRERGPKHKMFDPKWPSRVDGAQASQSFSLSLTSARLSRSQ
jgi:hypothetical protein